MNFQDIYETQMRELSKIATEINWQDKETYGLFCRQVYSWAVESSPLLAIAGARIQRLELSPKLKTKLKSRFFKHTQEELGHELDCIKDLKSLGMSPDDFPELPSTKAMWSSQYHVVQNENPLNFFGYVFMLEGVAVTEASNIAKKVSEVFDNANHFLKLHGDEDPEHIVKAFQSINELPQECLKGIVDNFMFSVACFKAILNDVQSYSHRKQMAA